MVGGFVQYQEIRVPSGETREGQSTSFASRKHSNAPEHVLASEQKAREMASRFRVVHPTRDLHRVEDRFIAAQLELSLREERDARRRRGLHVPLERGETADERAHQ